DQEAIRRAKNRLKAHLMELRLFSDEPALVWRAHLDLLSANLRYLSLMLRPAVILALPMVALLVQMEAFYGRAPLTPGRASIVTMQLKEPLDPAAAPPALQTPPEIAVETPAVRAISERQVSWRIRPLRAGSGRLRIELPGGPVDKKIEAGEGLRYLAERRVGSLAGLFWHPGEMPLSNPAVDWIEVHYPPAAVPWFGLELHWMIWLVAISMVGALLLKGRFRVSF
ncbi:MAG: hypothetical protein HY013_01440, partial [Candidatus Solibacter usitatus]|nr:hypothetical protein [Candidatus Solibacter usitatus]